MAMNERTISKSKVKEVYNYFLDHFEKCGFTQKQFAWIKTMAYIKNYGSVSPAKASEIMQKAGLIKPEV